MAEASRESAIKMSLKLLLLVLCLFCTTAAAKRCEEGSIIPTTFSLPLRVALAGLHDLAEVLHDQEINLQKCVPRTEEIRKDNSEL
ncbi:unnamed protein product [Caenorhabditis auriculariae]|uniref:Uncharacterized protein n=1 Tax=Caenorhabditis auriculariae TaxID=2777116 RepID=A0A8S1HG22_9PELO|nr:unnamed protein product [Caenorhabditis auriculariae]